MRKYCFKTIGLLVLGLVIGFILFVGASIGMQVSDYRPFCSQCHVMKEAAVTQKMSNHAKLSCNECHAPHNLVKKLPFKAFIGTKDVYLNMFGNSVEPVEAGEDTKQIVNTNCKTCHAVTNTLVSSMEVKGRCADCHRNVQHMRMKPISTRSVSDV
jgi:cytochrome c nitrite reductase small subunit